MKIKPCPRCGSVRFITTVHVTQTWVVDDEGCFESVLKSECDEATHASDENDLYSCATCGLRAMRLK
jgi:hypothetical protein